jgi:hypothetical protein
MILFVVAPMGLANFPPVGAMQRILSSLLFSQVVYPFIANSKNKKFFLCVKLKKK